MDFILIDAGHEYEDVIEDITCWYSKVRPGGHNGSDIDPKRKAVKEKFSKTDGSGKEAKDMVYKKMKIDTPKVNSKLHWTTLYSEKLLLMIGF